MTAMDLTRITTGQLHAMHVQAAGDCHAALNRAETAAEILLDLAGSGTTPAGDAALANYRILLAKARELAAHSRALYNEICRRTGIDGELAVHDAMHTAMHGGRTGNGAPYCRTCGFTDCPGAETGDCPRWPARDNLSGETGTYRKWRQR